MANVLTKPLEENMVLADLSGTPRRRQERHHSVVGLAKAAASPNETNAAEDA